MNHHLNLFRFFSESYSPEVLENNLSRAFALLLKNEPTFLYSFLEAVTGDHLDYLFFSYEPGEMVTIDLQKRIDTIEKEGFKTVYAIALTANKHISFEYFQSIIEAVKEPESTMPGLITDIFVAIKDTLFIIEVKRDATDCSHQLLQQVLPFASTSEIRPISYTWHDTIRILERIDSQSVLMGRISIFIRDFLEIIKISYPEWFEPKPFNLLPLNSRSSGNTYLQLTNRMRQALAHSHYQPLTYADRIGLLVNFNWATEIIPQFEISGSNELPCVVFLIWPGNTKGQGYAVFNRDTDWETKQVLVVGNEIYPLKINYHIKLCHFSRFIGGINFDRNDCRKPLHTRDNFYNFSGKWERNNWSEFESFLDEHFIPEFDWKSQCDWNNSFLKTDRSYLTMSLGYEVSLMVPFEKFRSIDKLDSDLPRVSAFIDTIVDAFSQLLD